MQAFTILTGTAAPLLHPDINTDLLAPLRPPHQPPGTPVKPPTTFEQYSSDYLFAAWRFDRDGLNPDFILNRDQFKAPQILLAGANFGCGSSRESAVWGLLKFGIRCVIAPSFATIFHGNCFKTGLLPVTLPQDVVESIAAQVEHDGKALPVTVSLVDQVVLTAQGDCFRFELSEFRRQALLNGLDDIQQTQSYQADIDAYEARQFAQRPWTLQ